MNTTLVTKIYLQVKSQFFGKRWSDDIHNLPPVKVQPATMNNVALVTRLRRIYQQHSTEELPYFFAANAVRGDQTCGVFAENAHAIFLDWKARHRKCHALVVDELSMLRDKYPIKEWMRGYPPNAIRLYLANELSPETLCFLCDEERFRAVKLHQNDAVFGTTIQYLRRYRPFVAISDEQFNTMIESVMHV